MRFLTKGTWHGHCFPCWYQMGEQDRTLTIKAILFVIKQHIPLVMNVKLVHHLVYSQRAARPLTTNRLSPLKLITYTVSFALKVNEKDGKVGRWEVAKDVKSFLLENKIFRYTVPYYLHYLTYSHLKSTIRIC